MSMFNPFDAEIRIREILTHEYDIAMEGPSDGGPSAADLYRERCDLQAKLKQYEEKAAAENSLHFDMGEPAEEVRNPSAFASIISDTRIGRYAIQLADDRMMPRDTTVLTALGIASAPVSMLYNVSYQHSSHIPTSLYVATEQPASSGKSGVITAFMMPIQKAIKDMNARTERRNEETEEDDSVQKLTRYSAFISDATPEALDKMLGRQYGHFCLASAEQALVNTALGLSYGSGQKSNNDLILKGATGDWHSSARVTRGCYEGFVFGSVTVIAQRGTIDTILEQSNGTGIAERFIMLAEPTLLGYRDHMAKRSRPDYDLMVDYSNAMDALILQYEQARSAGIADYETLPCLKLSANDWAKLGDIKARLEPTMADGGKYSHELLRGIVGKFDQRVMKLASVLHVTESAMAGEEVRTIIDSRYVDMAIKLAELSLKQIYVAMTEKGLIGMSAEEEVIYRIVSSKGQHGILWRELYNAAKGVQPFKSYPAKGMANRIKAVCAEMGRSRKMSLAHAVQGGRPVIKYYAL